MVSRRFTAVLVTAALAAAMPLVIADRSSAAESNGGVKIMPLGDSITDGITVAGAYRTQLWQNFVSAGAKVDFVGSLSGGPSSLGDRDHEGHSGWRIDQLDAQITGWVNRFQPKTVLLHIGTNDLTQNTNLSQAPNRLAGLIDKIFAAAPNTYVFVATVVPIGFDSYTAKVNSYNSAIPGIVQTRASAGKHIYLVDQFKALTKSDLAGDSVHPNASGYTKMANAWWAALQKVPASYQAVTATPTPSPSASR